jgi:transcriptional pleiotropic regulator of transition state genes
MLAAKIEFTPRIIFMQRRIFMKSTGVVRKVDELGRIVLPIEIRKVLDIKQKDAIEIFTDSDRIILQKYQPACVFCNNADNVVYFNGKRVCSACVEKLKSQF